MEVAFIMFNIGSTEPTSFVNVESMPIFWDKDTLANYLGVSKMYLCNLVDVADTQYKTFYIDKDTGAIVKYSDTLRLRKIDAPSEELKAVQTAIKTLLLELPASPANYGFISGKSIKDAVDAVAHGEVIVHCDIKDFFPSHTSTMLIKNLKLLFDAKWPGVISNSFIDFIVKALTLRGRLPQGSPASPAVTVVMNKDLDDKLEALGAKYNLTYARYADDLCFSGKCSNADCTAMLNELKDAVHPLRLNGKKTGIMRTSSRPVCTGYVITSSKIMVSTLQAKIASIIRAIDSSYTVTTSMKQIEVSNVKKASLEEFNSELQSLTTKLTTKYPSFNFKIKRKFYYIQSTKRVLGLNIVDGCINYPRAKYVDLRMEALIIGIQRALFYLKHVAATTEHPGLKALVNTYAVNSITVKTKKHSWRNLLNKPLNRKAFNGRRAYLKLVDEPKFNALLTIENKYFKKTIKTIIDKFKLKYSSSAVENMVRRYLQ